MLAEEDEPEHQGDEHQGDDGYDYGMPSRALLSGDEDALLRAGRLQIPLVVQLLTLSGIAGVRTARVRRSALRKVLWVGGGDAHVFSPRGRRMLSGLLRFMLRMQHARVVFIGDRAL